MWVLEGFLMDCTVKEQQKWIQFTTILENVLENVNLVTK
jgi:hypothetical protein